VVGDCASKVGREVPRTRRLGRFIRLVAHFAGGLLTLAFRFDNFAEQRRLAEIGSWSRRFLHLTGVRVEHSGEPPPAGLVVMNHISWLDVIVLNALAPSRFVAKSEVAAWPLVGYLCTRSGTLYIERNRKTAVKSANRLISDALSKGERVAVFPEGTTSEGGRLLHFHAALLQPVIASGGHAYPAVLRYLAPDGGRSPAVSYLGDETLLESVWKLLSAHLIVARIDFDEAEPAAGRNRRELAAVLHARISRRLSSDGPRMEPDKPFGLRS
jgi:1-acyl-sn-glycerol-3-phosphate acyltransferase